MNERNVLSDEMLRVRTALETGLLTVECVDFVSVAFSQADDSTVLITLGTRRPDLVQVQIDTILRIVATEMVEHLAQGRWQPEFHVLKGSVRR